MGAARSLTERLTSFPGASLRSERILPIGAAVLVLLASIASFQPSAAIGGSSGKTADAVRIAVGGIDGAGVVDGHPYDQMELESMNGRTTVSGRAASPSAARVTDDGTLYKPVLVDTKVADAKDLLKRYVVQSGDTLIGIADKAGVSMMTLWWANSLASKDSLHVGQTLIIPPVTGLVVTVTESDTLDGLAAKYNIDPARIVNVNRLEDTNLVIGQVLILPDAAGAPIPVPPPPPKPKPCNCSAPSAARYSGGAFAWPVVGGRNYISQYYHYGHYAIDIAATYGTPVVAAAAGTVVFSGWRNNGGGYQVWISHGGNLYTGYFHMSALTVSQGQGVGRAQQVGRIGATGWATGPHLHFVVSIGPIEGGQPVNPLRYY